MGRSGFKKTRGIVLSGGGRKTKDPSPFSEKIIDLIDARGDWFLEMKKCGKPSYLKIINDPVFNYLFSKEKELFLSALRLPEFMFAGDHKLLEDDFRVRAAKLLAFKLKNDEDRFVFAETFLDFQNNPHITAKMIEFYLNSKDADFDYFIYSKFKEKIPNLLESRSGPIIDTVASMVAKKEYDRHSDAFLRASEVARDLFGGLFIDEKFDRDIIATHARRTIESNTFNHVAMDLFAIQSASDALSQKTIGFLAGKRDLEVIASHKKTQWLHILKNNPDLFVDNFLIMSAGDKSIRRDKLYLSENNIESLASAIRIAAGRVVFNRDNKNENFSKMIYLNL